MDEKLVKYYKMLGVQLPAVESHGVDSPESPQSDRLKKEIPTNWRLEGNKLIGDTEFGPIAQMIPTDVLLVGTDSEGLPIFKKIV